MKEIIEALEEVKEAIEIENADRALREVPCLKKASIKILGQMSLVLNSETAARLLLNATQDVDALIDGEWFVTSTFKASLERRGLQFDFLSNEIWLPPDATFIQIYDSLCLSCSVLDPISALTSKAIKAPQKNGPLLRQALDLYGDKLAKRIEESGGNLDAFKEKIKFKV